jgi:hypothetical protein
VAGRTTSIGPAAPRHPAKASRRPARPGSLETTACPGQGPSADPAVDDEFGLGARFARGLHPGSAGFDVEPAGQHAIAPVLTIRQT